MFPYMFNFSFTSYSIDQPYFNLMKWKETVQKQRLATLYICRLCRKYPLEYDTVQMSGGRRDKIQYSVKIGLSSRQEVRKSWRKYQTGRNFSETIQNIIKFQMSTKALKRVPSCKNNKYIWTVDILGHLSWENIQRRRMLCVCRAHRERTQMNLSCSRHGNLSACRRFEENIQINNPTYQCKCWLEKFYYNIFVHMISVCFSWNQHQF